MVTTWKKIDNFMQDWYNSMSHPTGNVVMSVIGYILGSLIVVFMNII